jgi:predicted nucleic acid-binding protein
MNSIAIDTSPLVKILQSLVPGFPLIPGSINARLLDFLEWKQRQNCRFIIPTPVVAETIFYFQKPDELPSLIESLYKVAEVAPFDFPSAIRASELWKNVRGQAFRNKLLEDYRSSNECIKFDYQIAATAIVHGATHVISFDLKHFEPICQLAGLTLLRDSDIVLPPDDGPLAAPDPKRKRPNQPSLFEQD